MPNGIPAAPVVGNKRWYRRWWGILLITFLAFFVVVATLFILLVSRFLNQLQSGEVSADLSAYSTSSLTPVTGETVPTNREAKVVDDDDPSLGPADAALTIVEFADFQCPYCGAEYQTVREIMVKYAPSVRFIYRDFPIADVHPEASKASEAGMCAHEQGKFWPYHDKLYANQSALDVASLKRYAVEVGVDVDQFNTCLDSGEYEAEVEEDLLDGLAAQVEGTPTFFFNGYKVAGLIPKAVFEEVIGLFGITN